MAVNNNTRIDLNDYFPGAPANNSNSNNPTKPTTTDNIRRYLDQQAPLVGENSTNPFMKHKPEMFGADLDNHQFERYYLHPKFKQLGFNPYIDNEARYNQNSTFGDDLSRTSGQWWTLVGLGFSDAFSFGEKSDRAFAKEYDRAMKIGMSNRGGVGGFVNNLYLNSGYTFGIMGEIIAEEIGLAAGTLLTGGALGELALARTGVNASRFIKGLFSAEQWANKANKVVKALDAMQDVNVARNVFQALKTGSIGAGKFIGKNLVPDSYQFLANFNKLENLSGLAKTGKGFASMYRDIRNVRLAYGESALEAGMVENELLESNYKKFVDTYKRQPNEEEANNLRASASLAANSTFWANLPTIYFSNGITMNSMMTNFSPMRRLGALAENKFYKTMLTKNGIEVIEKGFKSAMKGFVQPKAYAKFTLDYLSANIAEGLQESAQEIISGTNKDYYSKLYGNATRGGYYDTLLNNVSKQFSGQGLETFASGFFMGGIVGTVSGAAAKVFEKTLDFTDPEYKQNKKNAEDNMRAKATMLDKIYKDPLDYNNPHLNDLIDQKDYASQMQEALEKGDQHAFETLKAGSLSNKLWTVLENGMEDTFIDRYTSLAKLSDEELLNEFKDSGQTADKIREDLNNITSKLNGFKKNYDFVKENLPNIFNPAKYKKGTPERMQEEFNFGMFNAAQKDLVMMKEGYTNSLKRMTSIMSEAVKDTGVAKLNATDVSLLFSMKEASNEISLLKQELKTLNSEKAVTKEAQALVKQKQTKLDNLTAFADAMGKVIAAEQPSEKDINKEIGTGEGALAFTKENILKASIYKDALQAYKNYIKGQAQGQPVFDKNLQTAFDKLLDYYKLETSSKNFTSSINLLMNPKQFQEYALRKKEVLEVEHTNRKKRIEEALSAYEKKRQGNVLLQALWAKNVFFDPEELKALDEEGIMPKRLFDRTGQDQILSTSQEYNEAVEIFKQYVENVHDIPLIYNKNLDGYDTTPREKFPNDTRTYEELAEQYGFDPKSAKTVLPAKEVLQKIVDSEFATEQEMELAARLLALAKDSDTITFVNDLAGPGIFTQDEQTVIDARYPSSEFQQNAQSYPLEVAILREEVNRKLYGAVDESSDEYDSQFNSTIDKIRSTAIKYFEDTSDGIMPVGLSSNEDFITEVMTSERFRAFLSEIEYDETQQSTWKGFLNAVIDYIKNIFGEAYSNTALNAAISAITSKIDDRVFQAKQKKTAASTAAGPQQVRPQDLSIDELRQQAPGLFDKIVELFKDYSQNFIEVGGTLPDDVLSDYASKTYDEIIASPEFNRFIRKQDYPRLLDLYNRYFSPDSQNVRVIPRTPLSGEVIPGIPITIAEPTDTIITESQREALAALGYTEAEIDSFSIFEAVNIIAFGENKGDTQARLAEMAEQNEYGANQRKNIIDTIDNIKTFEEYSIFKSDLDLMMTDPTFWNVTGFKSEELDTLLKNKLDELSRKIDFEDLNINDTVVLVDAQTGKIDLFSIIKKTAKQLTLQSVSNPQNAPRRINKADLEAQNKKNFIFKYNPETMANLQAETQTMSEEGTTVSNDNVQSFESLTDEEIDNADQSGKKINPNDALNNFLNNLNNACK